MFKLTVYYDCLRLTYSVDVKFSIACGKTDCFRPVFIQRNSLGFHYLCRLKPKPVVHGKRYFSI
jgi:hypothetical protein